MERYKRVSYKSGDLLVIYMINDNTLQLLRIGTHSQLLNKPFLFRIFYSNHWYMEIAFRMSKSDRNKDQYIILQKQRIRSTYFNIIHLHIVFIKNSKIIV